MHVDSLQPLPELCVARCSGRRLALPPRLETSARKAELRAHEIDREVRLLRLDESELHLLSFAKKAAARPDPLGCACSRTLHRSFRLLHPAVERRLREVRIPPVFAML